MSRAREQGGVVVSSPGGTRWMRRMATALSEAGLLRAYLAPIAVSDPTLRKVERLPRPLGPKLRTELGLRDFPPGIDESQIGRAAAFAELLAVGMNRSPAPWRVAFRFVAHRSHAFDSKVSRRLQPGDRAVIAAAGAATKTFRSAHELGIEAFLDYPMAHQDWLARVLAEEARLHPELVPTLQAHDLPAGIRGPEEEVASADRIFVLSSFHRRTFLEEGIEESKLVLTPLGVELELFKPEPRPDDGTFRVLFVGALSQRKGLSYMLDGFERAAIPNSELVLLGAPLGGKRIWEGRPHVRHLPPVPFGALPGHFHASDVFVLPSLVESFSQASLEAMACGLPVIMTENTFGTDVLTEGVDGYLVPIRDPDAIAERLRRLHADPDARRQMGEAARRRAEDFTWDRYGQRIVAAVEDLA